MKHVIRMVLSVCLAVGCASMVRAQEQSVPMVLQITREWVKPGRAGTAHEKTEGAFVEAMRKAKWPTNYLALASMSGRSRALFLTSYATFEAYEKDTAAVAKNTTLSSAVDNAYLADGELLEGLDQAVFYYDPDKSMNAHADLSPFRFYELTLFHVKPGKNKEWGEVVKMVKEANAKAVPDAHWGTFYQAFGGDGDTYLVITGHKSLSEVDKGFAVDGKKFEAAMGEQGMKKLNETYADCVESSSQQLFSVDPKMSYVKEEWIKADPAFWGGK